MRYAPRLTVLLVLALAALLPPCAGALCCDLGEPAQALAIWAAPPCDCCCPAAVSPAPLMAVTRPLNLTAAHPGSLAFAPTLLPRTLTAAIKSRVWTVARGSTPPWYQPPLRN